MKPNLKALLWFMLAGVMLVAPAGIFAATWAKTYGGQSEDLDFSMIKTNDGGFLAMGHTMSFGGAYAKAWVIKLNASGVPEWQKAWGGLKTDEFASAVQAENGDFILVGKTESYGAGSQDVFVMRLSSTGEFLWMKTFGGSQADVATSVIRTPDGGFFVVGYSYTFSLADSDVYVIKLAADGTFQWQRSYGGDKWDYAYSAIPTRDGGFIVAGITYSFGTDGDLWIFKVDELGDPVWQKSYGGKGFDGIMASSMIETADGGFAVAGSTMSYGSEGTDVWVLKFGPTAQIQWQNQYGGRGDDDAYSIVATGDGGYAFLATTDSFGMGQRDFWLVKLTSTGAIDWQKVYGGRFQEDSSSLIKMGEGLVMAGYTTSFGGGGADMFVASLDSLGQIPGACIAPVGTEVQPVETWAYGKDTTSGRLIVTRPPVPQTPPIENTNAVVTDCGGGQTCQLACTASASPASGEAPLAVTFSSTATAPNCQGNPSFSWTFGDGATSTLQNPSHTYTEVGEYHWVLTVTVENQTCVKEGTVVVTAKVCKLTCTAGANPTGGLAPLTVNFNASGTATDCIGQTVAYSWLFGDGSPSSNEQHPSHTYTGAGVFTWTMTASVDNVTCTQSGQITVSACTLSCQAYANPTTGLPPLTVNFKSSVEPSGCSGSPTRNWNFGDGGTSTEANSTHVYEAAGFYAWTFTATVDGVVCSRSGSVTVTSCSVACDASANPASGIAPLDVNFNVNVTPTGCGGTPTYAWAFGDGSTATDKSPSHTYANAGNYNWSVTVTVDGVTCSKGGTIAVSGQPCTITCDAQATPQSGTAPLSVAFSSSVSTQNCTGNPVYAWVFGDGGTSAEQNPSHAYTTAGAYNWSLTVSIGQVTCTKTGLITVSKPSCELTCSATATPASGVAPLQVTFAAEATATNCDGGISYAWDFGDGQIGGGQNTSHTYNNPGIYSWSLAVQVEGKTCVKSGQVTVTAPCNLTCQAGATPSSGRAPLTVQFGSSIVADGCAGAPAFSWAFGDGGTSAEQNPKHVYSKGGSYNWTLTVTIDGKSCNQSGTITIEPGLPGDCDGDGSVSIGEVQKAINMFLGTAAPDCGVDCDGSGVVTIGEVQKVINAFLGLPSSC